MQAKHPFRSASIALGVAVALGASVPAAAQVAKYFSLEMKRAREALEKYKERAKAAHDG